MKNVSDKLKVDLENRCSDLLADLRKYKRNEDPHDMKYESERETPLDCRMTKETFYSWMVLWRSPE
ncbi:5444_t:CDS:2 [Rhizophagus irregularis]|nr:5444_t:CDS:2 [Rhizophagus irregularis]